jgi:hypothetical protein
MEPSGDCDFMAIDKRSDLAIDNWNFQRGCGWHAHTPRGIPALVSFIIVEHYSTVFMPGSVQFANS